MKRKSDPMQLQVQAAKNLTAPLRDEEHWVVARRMNRRLRQPRCGMRSRTAMRTSSCKSKMNACVAARRNGHRPGQLPLNPPQSAANAAIEPATAPSSDVIAQMEEKDGPLNTDPARYRQGYARHRTSLRAGDATCRCGPAEGAGGAAAAAAAAAAADNRRPGKARRCLDRCASATRACFPARLSHRLPRNRRPSRPTR